MPTCPPLCSDTVAAMKAEMQEVLTQNILPFWMDKMQDRERGGFYGQMTGRYELRPDAPKGAILNARILWSFSAAYRVLRRPEYLEMARRAKDYFVARFIDPDYGGVYWSLDAEGRPLDTKKQFYALGFALYALSEYARATADSEALGYALRLFDCIEQHALDPQHDGYIEATTRDWQPIADMRLSDLDQNFPKSQNTHLHILEPYTNLLRALQELSPSSSPSPSSPLCSGGAAAPLAAPAAPLATPAAPSPPSPPPSAASSPSSPPASSTPRPTTSTSSSRWTGRAAAAASRATATTSNAPGCCMRPPSCSATPTCWPKSSLW